jgi:hypothetical protein
MFLWKRRSFKSTWSGVSIPPETYTILAFNLIIGVMIVIKASNRNNDCGIGL